MEIGDCWLHGSEGELCSLVELRRKLWPRHGVRKIRGSECSVVLVYMHTLHFGMEVCMLIYNMVLS